MSVTPQWRVVLVIPTLNAAEYWPLLSAALKSQTVALERVLIVDSSSTDGTAQMAAAAGFDVISITRAEFNHGRTRQMAAERMSDADIIVYMTQDALLLEAHSIARLIEPFCDPEVGAVYGRQVPHSDAGPFETHARHFNYPETSCVKSWEDRKSLGIRATFLSNSFSAYRSQALCAVGGFPGDTIMAEDALVAGKMLMAQWKIAYVAEATVLHSHQFSIADEFKRYFDTGVYHSRESWLLENFGKASDEGRRFVFSELKALWPSHLHLIPASGVRTLAKFVGYRLGLLEASLPARLRRKLSLHKRFWDTPL